MAKITKFTKQTDFKAIRAGLTAAMKTYGDSVGIKFELGNISFREGEFSTKLTAKIEGAESREDKELKFYMNLYNLQEDGTRGRKLVGYLPRCHRANFVFTDPKRTGKFRCELEEAKEWFAKVA
jgi:hypothetical protein